MIFHPPVLALVCGSLLSAVVLVWAGGFAARLLRQWDLGSGAESQIALERMTYLVSTLVAFVLALQAASLVLFAFNADRMAPLFVGAMCAVGTLNASVWGFPALWAKMVLFFAAFVWLVLDAVDNRTRRYDLIRVKYAALLLLAPFVVVEAALQALYFLDLKADTITSCCGQVFGEGKPDLGGDLAALDPRLALALLAAALVAGVGLAVAAPRHRAAACGLGLAAVAVFGLALAAIVAVVAPYVYELPHHHCPFCILKREYGHVGFLLYLPLFVATGAGLATGVLAGVAPRIEPAVAARAVAFGARVALIGWGLFAAVALVLVARSNLVLIG